MECGLSRGRKRSVPLQCCLREQGVAGRTLVFFSSDNGPWLSQQLDGGSAGLLRDGKGTTWEGGMREPGLAWWPGRINAGSVVLDLTSTLDMLPTFLKLAGIDPPADRPLDGYDISPVLLGTGPSPRKVMFFYQGKNLCAFRKGRCKIHLLTTETGGSRGAVKHDPPLLYDLDRSCLRLHMPCPVLGGGRADRA